MSENTLVNEDTGSSELSQAEATKTYTQKEVDDMMARLKTSVVKKVEKKYEDLGDPEELRQLKVEAEKVKQEQQIKRGEFDKILQEIVAKKDAEISKRDSVIKEFKVDVPLLNAASKFKAVNAEQVSSLLKNNLRLNENGEVEVVDIKGTVRYNDAGSLYSVDDLVKEFLDSNPHFVQPTPATTSTKNSMVQNSTRIDLNKLDMRNPEHRKQYSEARKKGLV